MMGVAIHGVGRKKSKYPMNWTEGDRTRLKRQKTNMKTKFSYAGVTNQTAPSKTVSAGYAKKVFPKISNAKGRYTKRVYIWKKGEQKRITQPQRNFPYSAHTGRVGKREGNCVRKGVRGG